MTPADHAERREFTRLLLDRPAVLHGPYGSVDGRLRDISLNGAKLSLVGGWAGSSHDRYSLVVEIAPGAKVKMRMALIHRRGVNAGFRCDRLDDTSLNHLQRLLALYHGDDDASRTEVSRWRNLHPMVV